MSAHVVIEFIKRVEENGSNIGLAKHFIYFCDEFINSIIQVHEC